MTTVDALLEELAAAIREGDKVKELAIKAELDRVSPRRDVETR